MQTVLHLGAHKTATTFAQRVLWRSRDRLAEEGIAYLRLNDFREQVTRRIWRNDPRSPDEIAEAQAKARAYIASATPAGAQRLILSDENLLGTPREIVSARALYPKAAARLEAIAEVIAPDIIYLGLRNAADFGRSIYVEDLFYKESSYVSPAEFREGWLAQDHAWDPLITTIAEQFPESRIVLWDFDGRTRPVQQVLSLSGLTSVDDLTRSVDRRASPSRAATEALIKVIEAEGKAAGIEQRPAIKKQFPPSRGDHYPLFDEDEIAAARRAHAAEMEALAARPGVEMLQRSVSRGNGLRRETEQSPSRPQAARSQ